MTEITKEVIFDIFNIKRDGSNIVDDDDDDVLTGKGDDQIPFGEKAKEVDASISIQPQGRLLTTGEPSMAAPKSPQEIPKVVEEKKEVKPMPQKNNDVEAAVKKPVDRKLFGDLFDDDEIGGKTTAEPVAAKPTPVPVVDKATEVVKVEPEDEPQLDVSVAQDTVAQQPSAPMSETPPQSTRGHRWKLVSPAPKYEKLYEEKRDLLSIHLLKGGEIPFSKFYTELESANVDVDVPTFDTEEVGRRISEVQKWRDRVKFIQLRVNSQYFVWKAIIDILPGVLARIEYERGKQEGIVYEHLNDFTTYYGHLEGLHKSCESVSKHLDSAYNSLSRQVAIAQPLQEVERYTNGGSQRPLNPQLQKWDSLPQANKGGASASTARTKEAPKGAEPTAGWEL